MKNITYTERNGIRYPNLTLPEQTNYPLGKYANLRLDFKVLFFYIRHASEKRFEGI